MIISVASSVGAPLPLSSSSANLPVTRKWGNPNLVVRALVAPCLILSSDLGSFCNRSLSDLGCSHAPSPSLSLSIGVVLNMSSALPKTVGSSGAVVVVASVILAMLSCSWRSSCSSCSESGSSESCCSSVSPKSVLCGFVSSWLGP